MIIQPSTTFDPGGSVSVHSPLSFSSSSLSSNLNSLKNSKNPKNMSVSSRFAPALSSPFLDCSDDLISFASLNVCGISVVSKFHSLLQDFESHNLSVIALQETKVSELTGSSHLNSFYSPASTPGYRAFWSFDPADRCGGVGFLLSSFVFKYVQRVHRLGSRFIAVDLFFPSRKLKIVNVYNYQTNDFWQKGLAFSRYIISHLKQAQTDGFQVIILGDFNLDPHIYYHAWKTGHSIPKHFSLLDFLFLSDYSDLYPVDSNGLEFSTHYVNARSTSRIDLIWQSSTLLPDECLFLQVWQPSSSQLTCPITGFTLDHQCVIVYYSMSLFLGQLPKHRVKQKGLWRSVFDTASATADHWLSFSSEVQSHLASNFSQASVAFNSTLPSPVIVLNSSWNVFKDTILSAARSSLPVKRLSSEGYNRSTRDPQSLIQIKVHLRSVNKIFAFLTRLLSLPSADILSSSRSKSVRRLTDSQIHHAWSSSPNSFYSSLVTDI